MKQCVRGSIGLVGWLVYLRIVIQYYKMALMVVHRCRAKINMVKIRCQLLDTSFMTNNWPAFTFSALSKIISWFHDIIVLITGIASDVNDLYSGLFPSFCILARISLKIGDQICPQPNLCDDQGVQVIVMYSRVRNWHGQFIVINSYSIEVASFLTDLF